MISGEWRLYARRQLLRNDQNHEGAGLHFAAAFTSGGRVEFGGGKKML